MQTKVDIMRNLYLYSRVGSAGGTSQTRAYIQINKIRLVIDIPFGCSVWFSMWLDSYLLYRGLSEADAGTRVVHKF